MCLKGYSPPAVSSSCSIGCVVIARVLARIKAFFNLPVIFF